MQTRIFRTESFRLSTIYASLFVVSMLALMALAYVTIDNAFMAEVMDVVDRDLAAIQKGYEAEGAGEPIEIINQRLAAPGASDLFLLQDRSGRKIAGNLPVMAPRTGRFTFTFNAPVLGKGILLRNGSYVFAGRDLRFAIVAERKILEAFVWVLVAVLVLGAAGGLLVSRSFLARMDSITATCRAIMAGNLQDRIPARGTRNELDQLANAINAMLDRISLLMKSLQQVSNDIAHDMRTPLTHLRNHLEMARAGGEADRTRALDGAIAETDQILSMFAALLRIAQIEAGAKRAAFKPVELCSIVARVADLYRPEAEDRCHTLVASSGSAAAVLGDRQLLLQMLANVLENSLTHTPPGTNAVIALDEIEGRPRVVIADNGPGVPSEEAARIFRRFYRLERSRSTPGTGLGLSLAAAIAELHGATIGASDNNPGLRIEILFPPKVSPGIRGDDPLDL